MSSSNSFEIKPSDSSWQWIKETASDPLVDDTIRRNAEHTALFTDDQGEADIERQANLDVTAKNLVLGKLADLIAQRGDSNALLVEMETHARQSETSPSDMRHIQLMGLLDILGFVIDDPALCQTIQDSSFGY